MAPGLRVAAVNELGDYVAKPAANGFLKLVEYKVERGKRLVASLHQGVRWNAGPIATLAPTSVLWQALLLEGGATETGTTRNLPVRRANEFVPWTLQDPTRPVVRNLIVEAGVTLQWGVYTTSFATIPAEIDGFYGAIVGWLCDEDFIGSPEFYELLGEP